MSKKQTNYLKYEDLRSIVDQLGFKTEDQAGFLKVFGPEGIQCYVAKTKAVSRIDLSHFTVDPAEFGCIDLGEDGKFGGVRMQLDFTLPHEEIAANFVKVLSHMRTLPPLVKKEAKAGKDKSGKQKVTASLDIAAIMAKVAGKTLPVVQASAVLEAAKDLGMVTQDINDDKDMDDSDDLSDEDKELERLTAPESTDDLDDAVLDRLEESRKADHQSA